MCCLSGGWGWSWGFLIFIFGFFEIFGKVIFEALIVFEPVLFGKPIIIIVSSSVIFENPDFYKLRFFSNQKKIS